MKSSSKWIRIQLNWRTLQPNAVASQSDSWAQLNNPDHTTIVPDLKRLDRQIQLANADGIGVILGPYQSFPSWGPRHQPGTALKARRRPAGP